MQERVCVALWNLSGGNANYGGEFINLFCHIHAKNLRCVIIKKTSLHDIWLLVVG